jgi:GntR family transcriptional regulator
MALNPKYYFQIFPSSGVPIYRQILDQVKIHVAAGHVKPEDFLPSVRQVAKQLDVNPMTVSKAYSLLENEGVVETVRGQGMRIRRVAGAKQDFSERRKDLLPLLREVAGKARQLSLDKKNVIELFEKLWEE